MTVEHDVIGGASREQRAEWLTLAEDIAAEAGRTLLRGWRSDDVGARNKGTIDLVTQYDLASEAILRERMPRAFPDHAIVAEEGASSDVDGEWTWFCDPLDGTTNFAHGHFFFAVSIGLAYRGEPVLGVVHAPALLATWSGGLGLGATRVDARPEGSRRAHCVVSDNDTLVRSLVATGFPYDRRTSPENNVKEHAHIVVQVQGMRRCGSAALDLCQVADGTYDGYWEQKLAPWDLCAGVALVRGAGGVVTDYEGAPVSVRPGRVVATNGRLHAELLREVGRARRGPL